MLKRNRVRPRTGVQSNQTTTTGASVEKLEHVEADHRGAVPLIGIDEQHGAAKSIKTQKLSSSIVTNHPVKHRKYSETDKFRFTTELSNIAAIRRYETPPSRSAKPPSLSFNPKVSKASKPPKLHLAKVFL